MDRDTIIRMARLAGFGVVYEIPDNIKPLERFAALVEQHLSHDSTHTCHDNCTRPACVAIREAVLAEREACAKVCEAWGEWQGNTEIIAKAIRARSKND